MHCPACARDNPEGSRFCNACGLALESLPADRLKSLRAFIPGEVAEKILSAKGLGDRRIVTALFCDVVGSTPLAEHLGPERFKVMMDQVLGRTISAVARYEGTVTQVAGDSLLAFFGAPLTHEDDPERAARAALDIRDTITAYNRDLESAYGVILQVRIGLNTGPVVLSQIVDLLQIAYTALGDTVNTAARLQSAAAPGSILASEATARLIEPLFELRRVEPLMLKGKQEPVAAVEIVSPRTVTGKPRGVEGLTSPLVGRDRELGVFLESVQALFEGRGQIVAIVGEAGIGKSRLVTEGQISNPSVRWLEGRCLSYAGTIPYFPFQDLLREWLGVIAADPEAKIRIELRAALDRLFGHRAEELYPYLGAMLRLALEPGAVKPIADLSAESLQHQTFNVMREWIAALAAQQPLALIFDDLHWADDASLSLLETLFEATEEVPVLIGLVFRPEREHGCWHLNDRAAQRFPHRHVEIVLHPLPGSSTEQLIENLLFIADLPPEIRELILSKAEGNPFFVEEVVRALIDAGVLRQDGDRWHVAQQRTTLSIPDNVQGILLSRIDRLPTDAKQVLQAASVIGRVFSLDLLKRVSIRNGKVEAALIDLQRHDLVVERRRVPQAEYRFKHALTQEVAYSTLTEERRRRLHGTVAQALENQHVGRLEVVYGLLAYHYDQAREEDRTVHFLLRAGDKSRAEYADQEALRYYGRAVELLKRRGDFEQAAQTLMKMALAHHIAFDFASAASAYREAFALAPRPPAPLTGAPSVTLRLAMEEPADVDTARATDAASALAASQVFEGLVRYAPELNITPGLARSWEISEDGTHYRFHLHADRAWSDGRPVTAHDFVFSWLRGMRGDLAHIFHDIDGAKRYQEGRTEDPRSVGVRALDNHTLDVILEGPRAYFPFILAHPTMLPHPRWVIERYGEEWTLPENSVANGPYRVAEWKRGSHARLVSNSGYAGPRGGNIDEIHWAFRKAQWGAPAGLDEFDIEILYGIEEREAAHLRGLAYADPPILSISLMFRCDRPPFDDRLLRLAFAHATDRRAAGWLSATGNLPADGGFVPPPLPGHSPQIGLAFNPERARHLLQEAGYPGGRGLGPFTITVPEEIPAITRFPTHVWKEILGVEVSISPVPFQQWFTSVRGSPNPIVFLGWYPDYPDPDGILRLVFHSASNWNLGGWKSTKFDALIEEARASTDERARMALYHDADRLLVAEDAAIVPLAYLGSLWFVHPRVRGWWSSILGPGRIADLVIEPESQS